MVLLSLMLPSAVVNATEEKNSYTLSHAGILQEGQFPDEELVRAGDLEEAVDSEGIKALIVQALRDGMRLIFPNIRCRLHILTVSSARF